MSRFEIEIENGRTAFAPGERIEGEMHWEWERSAERTPQKLELRLFWYTDGRGNEDVAIADSMAIERPGSRGSRDFRLEVPAGPLSFSGRLFSLKWALEMTGTSGGETRRVEILVTTTGSEIRHQAVAAPASE